MDHATVQTAGFARRSFMPFESNDGKTTCSKISNDGAPNHSSGANDACIELLHRDRASMQSCGQSLNIAFTPASLRCTASEGLLTVHILTARPASRARTTKSLV